MPSLLQESRAEGLSDEHLLSILEGFEGRRDQVLSRQVNNTFPGPADPDENPSIYAWNKLSFALAAFYRNEEIEDANQAVIDVRDAFVGDDPENADLGGEFGFHWRAPLLVRIYEMFHAESDFFPGRLTPEAEEAACDLLWVWARDYGRIARADTDRTWYIYESENHDAMRDTTSWGAAQILRRVEPYRDFTYADGSTAEEQYRAWSAFLIEYLRERGRRGLFVEIASNTYSKYTTQCLYNYYDLAEDPTLRHLAGSVLDLWWADAAHEWMDGVRGGSKARFARGNQGEGYRDGVSAMGWYYFGEGQPRNAHPGHMNLATSEYRPPLVVMDLALDREGRGTYEYRSRRPGLNLLPRPSEMGTWGNTRIYVLDEDFGGIHRYSYVTPDFIMGTSLVEKRPKDHWSSISDQNRWHGVIFRGHPDARIFPQATATTSNDRANNEQWSVQRKGTLITQKLTTSRRTAEMRVFFWQQLPRTEEDGWVFVEADHAYAAVRPVSGGYKWEGFYGNWMRLNEEYSPVIIEVARKSEFGTYGDFREAVKGRPLSYKNGVLEYTGVPDSGEFTFYADSGDPPEIDGVPVDYAPDRAYDSPFIRGDWPAGKVDIRKGVRRVVLDFDRTDFGVLRDEEDPLSVTPNDGNGANAFVFGDPDRRDDSFVGVSVKRDSGASASRKAYLRFDLSGADLEGALADAELRLTLSDFSPNFENWTFNVFGLRHGFQSGSGELGEDWEESALTWNNAPANDTTRGGGAAPLEQGGVTGDARFLGIFRLPFGHAVGDEIVFRGGGALADFLKQAKAENELATLIITREEPGSANFIFAARDSAEPPELRLYGMGKPERVRAGVQVDTLHASDYGRNPGSFELLLDREVDRDITVYFFLSGAAGDGVEYGVPAEKMKVPAGSTRASIDVRRSPEALFLEDRTLHLHLAQYFEYERGAEGEGVFPLYAVPMDQWRAQHFSEEQLAEPDIGWELSTPAGDGITNLMKYALGLNPFRSGVDLLPAGAIEEDHLTLSFVRPEENEDLIYQAEVSGDLQSWENGSDYIEVTETQMENGAVRLSARSLRSVGEAPHQFIRLRLVQK